MAVQRCREGHPDFVEPVCAMLDILGLPFVRASANEEILKVESISDMLVTIGNLLLEPQNMIQMAAVETLTRFSKAEGCSDARDVAAMIGIDEDNNSKQQELYLEDAREPARILNQNQLRTSGVLQLVIEALKREVAELLTFDTDGDGQISAEEMHRYKVMNDNIVGNETEEYDAEKEGIAEEARDAGTGEDPPPVFLGAVLRLLRELSYHPDNAREIIRSADAPKCLTNTLFTIQNFREPLMAVIVEILWNLLDHTRKAISSPGIAMNRKELMDKFRFSNAMFVFGNSNTITILKHVLERILVSGYRQTDKALRNEVLIVASMIAQRKVNHTHFNSSDFTNMTIAYATAAEMGNMSTHLRNFGTSDDLDFEFKQLLYLIMIRLANNDESAKLMCATSQLVETLLSYLDVGAPDTKKARCLKYTGPQLRSIRLSALKLLTSLSETGAQHFVDSNGHRILLDFIKDQQEDKQVLLNALHLMCHTILAIPNAASSLGQIEAIPFLTGVFSDHEHSLRTRTLVLHILAALCDENEENQTLFRRADGVKNIIEEMRDGLGELRKLEQWYIAAVECLWSAVMGNKRCEARLFAIDGVDALLDLLDVAPTIMLNQLTGCLADLARNPKSLRFFQIWRSDKTTRSLREMLFNFWTNEQSRLGITNDEMGVLANLDRPLIGKVPLDSRPLSPESRASERLRNALKASQQYKSSKTSADPGVLYRKAVNKNDLRTKMFALLQAIGYEDDVADEDDGDEGLTSGAKIFMIGAEQYGNFMKGAMWLDIKEELRRQDINPILADRLHMEGELEKCFNTALQTRLKQLEISGTQQKMDVKKEDSFHNTLKHRREQERAAEEIRRSRNRSRRR